MSSTLLDVLLTEQLVGIFRSAAAKRPELNARLVKDPGGDADLVGDGGTAVRITTTVGESLLVSPRRITREVGSQRTEVALLKDLVGYDWISRDLSEKVRLKEQHQDRLYLLLRDSRTVVLDHLGPAVHPLMAYLGKALELRSQKVILRRLDDDVAELITRCLSAAVTGPFFSDDELLELFEQDRASLGVVAAMWRRMNLAAPELRRTVTGVLEMLLRRRADHLAAWDGLVQASPDRVSGALKVFEAAVADGT
ncbi:MAG: hypothetical protein PVJ02_06560 [Gemmatimonadota bacterium]|jgi:hypothetical protein